MPRRLSEQVVVITGASSGIGRPTAVRLGAQGATVVLAARDDVVLGEVAAVLVGIALVFLGRRGAPRGRVADIWAV